MTVETICRLADFEVAWFGRQPQVVVLEDLVTVTGLKGTRVYWKHDGSPAGPAVSTRPNERVWRAWNKGVALSGLWSPTGGMWQFCLQPVEEQVRALLETTGNAKAAARMASEWGLKRLGGKIALDVLLERIHKPSAADALGGLGPLGALASGGQHEDTHNTVEDTQLIKDLLPYLREVIQNPSLVLALLSKRPDLTSLVQREMEV